MAHPIISSVLERVEAILSEASSERCVKKELVKHCDMLRTVGHQLEDAGRRGVKEATIRGWLQKLVDHACEVEDILDEWEYYGFEEASAKKKVRCSFVPSSSLCFNKVMQRATVKKIQKVNASLDEILKEKAQYNFVTLTVSHLRYKTTSTIDVEKVEGMDIERNKHDIVRKLMMDGERQQIVSIVGMKGIGKTTLAQLIYNDSRVNDCFDLRIWICVSDPFDVADVARRIIENVGSECPPNTNQLEVILRTVENCISGRKFLLVLDDVWTEEDNNLEPLIVNLKCGAASSKILVTTRKEGVAQMMGISEDGIYRPEKLTDDECWSLLRCISFRGKEVRGEFEEVGKKLASKCMGLPLAVNILGCILQSKNSLEEWENILESDIWASDVAKTDIFSVLQLIYTKLPPSLNGCFSYIANYPNDFEIDVNRLIEEWLALGYPESVNEIAAVELKLKWRESFEDLARRFVFQEFETSGLVNQIKTRRMHAVVLDFAKTLRMTNRVEDRRMTESLPNLWPFFSFSGPRVSNLFLGQSVFSRSL